MRTLLVTLLLAAPLSFAAAQDPASVVDSAVEQVDHTQAWHDYLARQRAQQVERLMAYADARVFPLNTTTPGLQSQLLDGNRNPCAMAHLAIASGQGDLIATLADKDNALQFAEVTEGPLYDWIVTSGLTQEEAAFVQEPDFYIEYEDEQIQELMVQVEIERLSAHFRAAAV